ncbi:MAG: flagellar biosynthesis protein FlhA [Phycisphaerae bacterium]|nr:flagellar biosynthesis protein FlhA [Phycisphaerae bacterium]
MTLRRALEWLSARRDLVVPCAFLGLVVVLVIPMPTWMMDLLLCGNIALSAIVLLTVITMRKPLDFSVFPALLLGTTLLRLVLNVASTRLILGMDAPTPAAASGVAGHVIEAFASVVAGSNVIVGAVVFVILVVVQFVVITKGATRMSEVAARFALDALPGKQMAIDAELSSGAIDEKEARRRREEIMREADFYGAMDGASKFVRGDAIAGIVITIVNVVGGFAIATLQKGWSPGESLKTFSLLAIGDGLVSQIPAFIVAVAAGLIVARAGGGRTIGSEIPAQIGGQPVALWMISGFLFLMAATPLPALPLLIGGAVTGALALAAGRALRRKAAASREESASAATTPPPAGDSGVDALEIEIGYGLVRLVDAPSGGDLLDRVGGVRRQLAAELGLVIPPVRIRDNVRLPPNAYRIRLRGAAIGEGTVHPDRLMAMDSGVARVAIEGVPGREPAFGLDAIWIEPDLRSRAESLHYTVVEPSSVVATHLVELVREHADELLSREEVAGLLQSLKARAPKLVEETVPAVVKPAELQKVLQSLLRERVPIRDLESILESISDWIGQTRDPDVLVEYARNSLRRTICQQYAELDPDGRQRLHCVTLDPAAEGRIAAHIERSSVGTAVSVPPALGAKLARAVAETAKTLAAAGRPVVVVTGPGVRSTVRQILAPHIPGVAVLGYNELARGVDIESVGLVQLEQPAAQVAA